MLVALSVLFLVLWRKRFNTLDARPRGWRLSVSDVDGKEDIEESTELVGGLAEVGLVLIGSSVKMRGSVRLGVDSVRIRKGPLFGFT